jgi:long-chain acyl-CoA synthetase
MANKFQPPYAVEAMGYDKKDGETCVYRHFMFAEKLLSHPPNIFNMWQMYLHGYHTSKGKKKKIIRHREKRRS